MLFLIICQVYEYDIPKLKSISVKQGEAGVEGLRITYTDIFIYMYCSSESS